MTLRCSGKNFSLFILVFIYMKTWVFGQTYNLIPALTRLVWTGTKWSSRHSSSVTPEKVTWWTIFDAIIEDCYWSATPFFFKFSRILGQQRRWYSDRKFVELVCYSLNLTKVQVPQGGTSVVTSPVLNLDWFKCLDRPRVFASTFGVTRFVVPYEWDLSPKTLPPTQLPMFTVWLEEHHGTGHETPWNDTVTQQQPPSGLVGELHDDVPPSEPGFKLKIRWNFIGRFKVPRNIWTKVSHVSLFS